MEISILDDLQIMIQQKDALLVYFYNDNCAPCKSLRPKVSELIEQNFEKMHIVFVNSIHSEITSQFGIFENPTILVFFEGKEFLRKGKYVSVQDLRSSIERYYTMLFE